MSTFRLISLFALAFVASCGSGQNSSPGDADPSTDQTAGAQNPDDDEVPLRDIAELLRDEPRFSTLHAAVEAADLMETLGGEGPFTLFAPSNEAFENLPGPISVDVLTAPENKELLRRILSYHVVADEVRADDIVGRADTLQTVAGGELAFDGEGSVVLIGVDPGRAVLVLPDINLDNGVIHVIDAVLLPPAE